jgi:hypothetical protein
MNGVPYKRHKRSPLQRGRFPQKNGVQLHEFVTELIDRLHISTVVLDAFCVHCLLTTGLNVAKERKKSMLLLEVELRSSGKYTSNFVAQLSGQIQNK